MATEIDALPTSKSIGWTDALLTRLGANSIGLGARLSITAPANASALSSTGYSLTGSNASSMIDLAGTLNTTGSPAIIKVAMTNTASGATTKFLSFLAGASGTTEVFNVDKAGKVNLGPDFLVSVGGRIELGASGDTRLNVSANAIVIAGANLQFAGSGGSLGAGDVVLLRDGAANTLALRNAANAQCLNIYGTWTSASVYERAFMRYSVANTRYEIGAETLGGTAGNTGLAFFTNGAARVTINTSGVLSVAYINNGVFGSVSFGTGNDGFNSNFNTGGNGSPTRVRSNGGYGWAAGSDADAVADTALKRTIAGVVGITNGSTGGGALGLVEMTSPAAPATNGVYIFAEDNGSGKTRLMARFATGAAQQISIEP